MVVVLSRFREPGGSGRELAAAFRELAVALEGAPGFIGHEALVDSRDAADGWLLTRWTDAAAFERWRSRAGTGVEPPIAGTPGVQPDPAAPTVLIRLDETAGALERAVADAMPLFADYAATSSGLYVFALSLDGAIRACNAAACEHLEHGGSLEGKSLLDYLPEADAARLRDVLSRPGRHGPPLRFNIGPLHDVPCTLDAWMLVGADGAVLLGQPSYRRNEQLREHLMAINQDLAVLSRERSREVREERHGREEAEKLNRDRNTFLTVLAHELRQPLGGALAAVGVLRKINPDPRLERPRLLLERQLLQMNRLVEDLADTARVASGEVELRRDAVDVGRQLRELATAWDALAQQQQKTFTSTVPDTPLVVWADADRLQQIFSNLVSNALKYTPPGGNVSLSAAASGDTVSVTVRDEGEGIAPERLPRVFELFQRATTTGSGLGVGLAVVRALVKAHGGTVTADSDGVGRGATFTVRLPLAAG